MRLVYVAQIYIGTVIQTRRTKYTIFFRRRQANRGKISSLGTLCNTMRFFPVCFLFICFYIRLLNQRSLFRFLTVVVRPRAFRMLQLEARFLRLQVGFDSNLTNIISHLYYFSVRYLWQSPIQKVSEGNDHTATDIHFGKLG